MKRFILAAALALLLALGVSSAALAQDFPSPQGYVNDFAGVMSSAAKASLEAKLDKLEQETGAEVAVVTVADMGGTYIEDYAVRLFEEWGIGKADQDNGILFLIAISEHKTRIEVGYGLEDIITDARAGRILDDQVLPSLRNGDYDTGITRGAAAIEDYIRNGTPPAPLEDNPLESYLGDNILLLCVLGYITVYMLGFMARSKSYWLGGVWGVIVGPHHRPYPGQRGGGGAAAHRFRRYRHPAGLCAVPQLQGAQGARHEHLLVVFGRRLQGRRQ